MYIRTPNGSTAFTADFILQFEERLRVCTIETIPAIEESIALADQSLDDLRLGAAIRRAELEQREIDGSAPVRIPEGSSGDTIEVLLRFDELFAATDAKHLRLAIAKLAEAEQFSVAERRKLRALRMAANLHLAKLERGAAPP